MAEPFVAAVEGGGGAMSRDQFRRKGEAHDRLEVR